MDIKALISGSISRPEKRPLAKGERSAEGGAWCIVVMPVVGLFLEMFAKDRYSGAVLWLTVLMLILFGCIADHRQISEQLQPADRERLKEFIPIPPAYLFIRDKLIKGEPYRGIALAMLMAAAVFANGFTQGLMLNEDNIPEKLEKSSVMNLNNFSGTSENIIGEQLDGWFDDDYETFCTHKGDTFTIAYRGMHDGKSAEVTIEVVHDGYTYQSIKAADVTIDGNALEGDERNDTIKKIFIGEEADADEESSKSE